MIARATRETPVPSLEQIHRVLEVMPAGTPIEKRDRALIAFAILTGARDGALRSFRLKHVDLDEGCVRQVAAEVDTKFAKTFTTWFFPVGGLALEIVSGWVGFLRTEQLWGPDDPLFPSTLVAPGPDRQFRAQGLDRRPWSNAGPIRAIFKAAFTRAGLPYFNPHSFRNCLVRLGEDRCRTAAEFKAWSQNLGHEKVLTTLLNYGGLTNREQCDAIRALHREPDEEGSLEELVEKFARVLTKRAV